MFKVLNCFLGLIFYFVEDKRLVVFLWVNFWREEFALVKVGFDLNLKVCGCWKILIL